MKTDSFLIINYQILHTHLIWDWLSESYHAQSSIDH